VHPLVDLVGDVVGLVFDLLELAHLVLRVLVVREDLGEQLHPLLELVRQLFEEIVKGFARRE